jgi:Cu+-exporting ATPase
MDVSADSPHAHEHEGVDYRFCSAGCEAKFAVDPARYLQPLPAVVEEAPEGAKYTCPMHPEIVQDGPGDCPICGMALEPVTVTLDEEDDSELRG